MAFNKFDKGSNQNRFQASMHDVSGLNIKCKDCGVAISELPFQPDPARLDTLRCKDCMRAFRESRPRRF
jgi:hypothetical protein